MSDDLASLRAELDAVPVRLRGSLRPLLPHVRAEPRGWRDVLRCLIGRHRTALSGRDDSGMFIERCSCGAMRLNRCGWFDGRPFRITDVDGYTRRQRRDRRRITAAVDEVVRRHFPE